MSNQTKTNTSFLCIELLESFSKKELQKFSQFINSTYFNSDKRLIQLFKLIEKEVLNETFTETLQSKIYTKVFDEKVNKNLAGCEKKKFRAKLSKLNQLAHHFLVTEGLSKNKNVFNDLLYTSLLDKRQFSAFQLLVKRDRKRLSIKERKSNSDFEHLYKIEMRYLDYLFYSDRIYKNTDYNFEDVLCKLNVQYLTEKLTLLVTIFSDKLLTSKYEKCSSSLKIIEHLLYLNISHPNIAILYAVLKFLREPNNFSYKNLLNLLNQNQSQIPLQELKLFYLIISNFFVDEIQKGNLTYEKDFTELYFLLDRQNLLITENMMPVIKLKNIVVRMCKENLFNKAHYFVEKYISYIKKEHQYSIKKLCFSYIFYYGKEYDKALDYIIQVDSVNPTIEFNYRVLMMKIYFELDKCYSEKTERLYRSAEKFFNDNKLISAENKKACKNFTHILINLYRFKHNEGRMTLEKLQTKLEQQEYNADKKWLLEKMEELKQ